MIISDSFINFDGRELVRTYSNEGRYVCRDGQQWEEAVDPPDTGRTYTEGDLIPDFEIPDDEALSLLLEGVTE